MADRCWVVIPAAGSGSRFGADVPKQYQLLNGKMVIDRTLSVFLNWEPTHKVVVAVSPADDWFEKTTLGSHPNVIRVTGGAERADSVRKALEYVCQHALQEDKVMVHDAARPVLQTRDLDRLWALRNLNSAIFARPIADTLKRSQDGAIQATVSRDNLWGAQTPQMATPSALLRALRTCSERGISVTDEASALEAMGERVSLVEGPAYNIKITRADDLVIASALLEMLE